MHHKIIIGGNNNILADNEVYVNSIHHQAIKDLGTNCIISAKSLDGIIEGIEMPNKKFVMGLQWHPEMIKIFHAFVESCT